MKFGTNYLIYGNVYLSSHRGLYLFKFKIQLKSLQSKVCERKENKELET